LPYQKRTELSASLSAADLHLVVMGQNFVGVVHPCKIYNIMAVGCPVLYVGPRPSPTLDTLGEPRLKLSYGAVAHGDEVGLIKHIRRVRDNATACSRESRSVASGRGETMLKLMAQLELLAGSSRTSMINRSTRGLKARDETGMQPVAGAQSSLD
jgi:hypothetical protein